ncbi:MAG TPA: hypothetical protein PKE29_08570 [Phycisphaerales bacterium]|nr:hypothetical protein [Phycisphaerales bacterium]
MNAAAHHAAPPSAPSTAARRTPPTGSRFASHPTYVCQIPITSTTDMSVQIIELHSTASKCTGYTMNSSAHGPAIAAGTRNFLSSPYSKPTTAACSPALIACIAHG